MWAVTHLCYILPASCLFDYKMIGFICPQQTPFGPDRQLGQLLCWHCCQEVWKGTRGRGWLLHSQKAPTLTSLCKYSCTKDTGWVCVYHPSPAVQNWCFWTSSSSVLLGGDADPIYYQCRRAARKRTPVLNPFSLSELCNRQTMCCVHIVWNSTVPFLGP